MATNSLRLRTIPQVELLEARDAPSVAPWLIESFDATSPGQLPSGWATWSNGAGQFGVSAGQGLGGSAALTSSASLSSAAGRAWLAVTLPPDVQVSASIFASTLVPVQLVARASGLDST